MTGPDEGQREPPEAWHLRSEILALVRKYAAARWPATGFAPGDDPVAVSGKVFDADEVSSLVDASLDFWLTTGRFAQAFESGFCEGPGSGPGRSMRRCAWSADD